MNLLAYFAHLFHIAAVIWRSDAAYIVIRKHDGRITVEEQGELFINRELKAKGDMI